MWASWKCPSDSHVNELIGLFFFFFASCTLVLPEHRGDISLPCDWAFLRVIGSQACKCGRPSGRQPVIAQSLSILPVGQEDQQWSEQLRDFFDIFFFLSMNHRDCATNFNLSDVGLPGSAAASIGGRPLLHSQSRLVWMSSQGCTGWQGRALGCLWALLIIQSPQWVNRKSLWCLAMNGKLHMKTLTTLFTPLPSAVVRTLCQANCRHIGWPEVYKKLFFSSFAEFRNGNTVRTR